MGDFSTISGQLCDDLAGVTASSIGTTITASGTAHTKGSYTQLIASTAREYSTLFVTLMYDGSTTRAVFLVDIALDSATETIVIPDL